MPSRSRRFNVCARWAVLLVAGLFGGTATGQTMPASPPESLTHPVIPWDPSALDAATAMPAPGARAIPVWAEGGLTPAPNAMYPTTPAAPAAAQYPPASPAFQPLAPNALQPAVGGAHSALSVQASQASTNAQPVLRSARAPEAVQPVTGSTVPPPLELPPGHTVGGPLQQPPAWGPPIAEAPCEGCGEASFIGCATCGHCDGCIPGRPRRPPCVATTRLGRFLCAFYECTCCPDPCYDPHWLAVADAAFFTAAARPQSQQRIRWNAGHDLIFPDRAEYFWARADGSGKGPKPTAPNRGASRVNYDELMMYTETAHLNFSFFFELPYRSNDAIGAPAGSGFGDITIGTKSLLMDCELLQITFQMRTTMPQGNPLKGLGVGHVSLEPSLLFGLNLAPDRYLQAQLSQWIPIGGDPTYAGSILHYHFAHNRVLFHAHHDVKLIRTLGLNGYSFQDGAYTDPTLGTVSANDQTYLSAGPGVRLVICDKIDFGVAADFALTKQHFARQLVRSEFRWRY